jgi:hypothetical protein
MSSKITISHPEMGEIEGERVPFTIEKEDWNVYLLADGTHVRVRLVVSEIFDTGRKTPDGEPLIAVLSTTLVSAQPVATR